MGAHVYNTGTLILDADDMHIHCEKTTCTFIYHKQTLRGVQTLRSKLST